MKKHFLVVDDSELNLRVVQALLEKNKVEADFVSSAEHAYIAIAESDYDLILMDYMMPDVNGIEATRHIRKMTEGHTREYYRNIPIIALTAEDSPALKSEMLKNGINDIMQKPIKQAAFCEMLSKWAPTVHGIDESTLMGMLDADRSSYLELITIFCQDAEGKHTRIKNALAAEDYQAYTVEVHKIKGEARVIGAAGLSEAAKILEFTGKALTGAVPNDKSEEENKRAIKRDTPKVLKALTQLVNELKGLLEDNHTSVTPAVSAETATDVISQTFRSQIEKLSRYTKHALEAIDEADYNLTREWLDEISGLLDNMLK